MAAAKVALARNELDDASSKAQSALDLRPDDAAAKQLCEEVETVRLQHKRYGTAMLAAHSDLERNDVDAAERHARLALGIWPEGPEARQLIEGMEKERQRRIHYDTAITAAKRALEQQDYSAAKSHLDEALKFKLVTGAPPDSLEAEAASHKPAHFRPPRGDAKSRIPSAVLITMCIILGVGLVVLKTFNELHSAPPAEPETTASQSSSTESVNPAPTVPIPSAPTPAPRNEITRAVADHTPISVACPAQNPASLGFWSSNLKLLPLESIHWDGRESILLQPTAGVSGEADVVITAAAPGAPPATNAVHLKITGP